MLKGKISYKLEDSCITPCDNNITYIGFQGRSRLTLRMQAKKEAKCERISDFNINVKCKRLKFHDKEGNATNLCRKANMIRWNSK